MQKSHRCTRKPRNGLAKNNFEVAKIILFFAKGVEY